MWASGESGAMRSAAWTSERIRSLRASVASRAANQYICPWRSAACMWGAANPGSSASTCSNMPITFSNMATVSARLISPAASLAFRYRSNAAWFCVGLRAIRLRSLSVKFALRASAICWASEASRLKTSLRSFV